MARNKDEYLIEKGILPPKGLGEIFFAYYHKDTKEVTTFVAPVWRILPVRGSISYFIDGYVKKPFERKKYIFKCAPYEIDFNSEDTEGESFGMASGVGDLLRWGYYAYKDPEKAQKKYEELIEELKNGTIPTQLPHK